MLLSAEPWTCMCAGSIISICWVLIRLSTCRHWCECRLDDAWSPPRSTSLAAWDSMATPLGGPPVQDIAPKGGYPQVSEKTSLILHS